MEVTTEFEKTEIEYEDNIEFHPAENFPSNACANESRNEIIADPSTRAAEFTTVQFDSIAFNFNNGEYNSMS